MPANEPAGSAVPGVAPGAGYVRHDTIAAHDRLSGAPAASEMATPAQSPDRRNRGSMLVAELWSVVRGDRYMIDAYPPVWRDPTERRADAEVTREDRDREVAAGLRPALAREAGSVVVGIESPVLLGLRPAGSQPIRVPPGRRGAGRLAVLRGLGRRRRALIIVGGSLAAAAVLGFVLAGRRHEFAAALSGASTWVLAVTVLLQIVALLARSEAWHLSIGAAGGTVGRRVLYRASSLTVLGSVLQGQVGVAARIAALRRSSPAVSPQVPTLIAAEFPILAVEAALAALTSFTLVGPLGLAWWLPIVALAVIASASAGLRHLALRKGRELWKGLALIRSLRGASRMVGFVLVAVLAQIFRNWLLLHAVGVNASFFDAIAVLIAMVTLGQLPIGPSVGAGAAVLILGSDGVAMAAAAGVLLTVTGTIGGLLFAGWAGADTLWSHGRRAALRRARRQAPQLS
jgi:uncharacterized membrane protein YbhN (UPF0104 family)